MATDNELQTLANRAMESLKQLQEQYQLKQMAQATENLKKVLDDLQAVMGQPAQEEIPDGPISIQMQCTDCGHIQTVKGNRFDGANYFGSAYDFCDKCDGLPKPI